MEMEQLSSEIDTTDAEEHVTMLTSSKIPEPEIMNKASTFDFETKSWSSDFTLIVEEKRLYVSKVVLGLLSPVFSKMFQSDFKESTANELELPGKHYVDVLEFLQCIYPNVNKSIDGENVLQVLPFVEEYQIVQRKPECEKILLEKLNRNKGAENIFALLKEAELYNLGSLLDQGIQLAAAISKEDLEKTKVKVKLSSDVWVKILERKYQWVDMENTKLQQKLKDLTLKTTDNISSLQSQLKDAYFDRDVLLSICRQQTKVSKDESFTKGINWKDVSVLLSIEKKELVKKTPSKTSIQCWGKSLFVSVILKTYGIVDYLIIEIGEGTDFQCVIYAEATVVKRFGTGKENIVWIKEEIKPGYCKILRKDLVNFSAIDKPEYVGDGKLCVLVHVFLSEPVPILAS